ncbi:hypothetical protein SEA_LUCHADOR_77 [Mycobacterium phage Luchador]|uniref:Uncharacterized protein n=1 Tax=Mycobacterium phage Luchador TaxID=1647300 RepID=A0A0F6WDN2_9CAUD|nr:hypothetical protein AVT52_gp27 [Mycobacterium phage Luchador]AKF14241.1 hypothetical protein SEA_LUCHADOR_77 [Mycobacterium phage Luchador]
MPLAKIGRLFPDLAQSEPEVITYEHGFIWAQKCEVWFPDRPEDPCTILLVYRSIQVRDTSQLYRDVAQTILEAECQDVLFEAIHENAEMLRGKATVTMHRLSSANHARWFDRARVEHVLKHGVRIKFREAA